MTHELHPRGALAVLALALSACSTPAPPKDAEAPAVVASATASASASAPAPAASIAEVPSATASASASAAPASEPPPPPERPDNKVEPTQGPELQERAKALFEAIMKDDPAPAEPFWFPEAPFTPLKDIKEPNKYWKQLHRTYAKDIHKLHKKRGSWDGASFVRFDGWSTPKWVKPGEEANKIGYYRAFRGSLRYRIGGEESSIEVRTIITWQGRWYITHLSKFK